MPFCLWGNYLSSASSICRSGYAFKMTMILTDLWWDKERVPSIIVVEMANIAAGGDQHARAYPHHSNVSPK